MISDSRTDTAAACASALQSALGGSVSWLPDERRFINAALARGVADPTSTTILLCGGDTLGPSAHLRAAALEAIQSPLPGFGEALRRQLEPSLGPRALLIDAPAGGCQHTAIFVLPLSEAAVSAAVPLLTATLDIYLRHLRGEHLADLPAASTPVAPSTEAEPASAAPPVLEAQFEDVPAGVSITAMPDTSAPPEQEQLASGWRAGLRAIGGRLDGEIWAKIPEELAQLAPAREILERAGQRAAVFLPDGRMLAAFGFPDLQREQSRVLLVGDGAPVAEVIALHRHPRLAGLTIWGSRGLLPSADTDAMALAQQRLGRVPPDEGELFAIDHDAIYLQRGGVIFRWDGRSQDREGTEGQVIASLLLRWSQR